MTKDIIEDRNYLRTLSAEELAEKARNNPCPTEMEIALSEELEGMNQVWSKDLDTLSAIDEEKIRAERDVKMLERQLESLQERYEQALDTITFLEDEIKNMEGDKS